MTPDGISWAGLLTLMVDGPDLPVHGVISSRMGNPPRPGRGWVGLGGPPLSPRFADGGSAEDRDLEWVPPEDVWLAQEPRSLIWAWRAGERMRLERLEGLDRLPLLIADYDECWQFHGADPVPQYVLRGSVLFSGSGTEMLYRRSPTSYLGSGYSQPTGPVGVTNFLGRPAYTVELAPPPDKPFPVQLVVDAETGLVLQQRVDAVRSVDEWIEITVGEPLDDGLFRWQGPVVSEADRQARRDRDRQHAVARGADWFRANVAPLPLRVEVDLGLFVFKHKPDGSFQASLGENNFGMLARRPRSEADWELGWHEVQHRWSANGWDWALNIHEGHLTQAGLASLKRALGAG